MSRCLIGSSIFTAVLLLLILFGSMEIEGVAMHKYQENEDPTGVPTEDRESEQRKVTVTGKVFDLVYKEKEPLAFVIITTLFPNGKTMDSTTETNSNGVYIIKDLPISDITLQFRKRGYVPEPEELILTALELDEGQENGIYKVKKPLKLHLRNPPDEYVVQLVKLSIKGSKDVPSEREYFENIWGRLHNISPESKALFANLLVTNKLEVYEYHLPLLNEYASAEKMNLIMFDNWVKAMIHSGSDVGKENFIEEEDLGLSNALISDIVAYRLKDRPKVQDGILKKLGDRYGQEFESNLRRQIQVRPELERELRMRDQKR